VGCLALRNGTAAQSFAQRRAFEQLGDDVRPFVLHSQLMDRQQIRMIENARRLRFLLKARETVAIAHKIRWQDFDGNVAADARIAGPINLAHTAGAEERDDFVRADATPDGEHRWMLSMLPVARR